jgi:hypothetical protein
MLAMTELIHGGSVIAAFIGTCCAFGERPPWISLTWVPGVISFLAMWDVMLGLNVMSPLAWAAVLVIVAMMLARGMRQSESRAMVMHRSLGLLAMASVIACMNSADLDATAGSGHSVHDHGSVVLIPYVLVFSLIVVALATWFGIGSSMSHYSRHSIRSSLRNLSWGVILQRIEVVSMAFSMTLMSVALAIHA